MSRWFRRTIFTWSWLGLGLAGAAWATPPLRAPKSLGARAGLMDAVSPSTGPAEAGDLPAIEIAFALAAPLPAETYEFLPELALVDPPNIEVETEVDTVVSGERSMAGDSSLAATDWWMEDAWQQLHPPRHGAVVVLLPSVPNAEELDGEPAPPSSVAAHGSNPALATTGIASAYYPMPFEFEASVQEFAFDPLPLELDASHLEIGFDPLPVAHEDWVVEIGADASIMEPWSPSDLPPLFVAKNPSLPADITRPMPWASMISIQFARPFLPLAPLVHLARPSTGMADHPLQSIPPEHSLPIPAACGLEFAAELWKRCDGANSLVDRYASPHAVGRVWYAVNQRLWHPVAAEIRGWGERHERILGQQQWAYSAMPVECELDRDAIRRVTMQFGADATEQLATSLERLAAQVRGWSRGMQRVADGTADRQRF